MTSCSGRGGDGVGGGVSTEGGGTRQFPVSMGQFFILIMVVVPQIYTCNKMTWNHTHTHTHTHARTQMQVRKMHPI